VEAAVVESADRPRRDTGRFVTGGLWKKRPLKS